MIICAPGILQILLVHNAKKIYDFMHLLYIMYKTTTRFSARLSLTIIHDLSITNLRYLDKNNRKINQSRPTARLTSIAN